MAYWDYYRDLKGSIPPFPTKNQTAKHKKDLDMGYN